MHVITCGLMSVCALFLTAKILLAHGTKHPQEKGVHRLEIPEEYRRKKNLYWSDIEAIIAGSKIYKENCARCHGASGRGDGPLAKSMNPKPFSFYDSKHMSQMNDAYLYWRTVEGGEHPPFKSKMPAYKNTLTEEEVWKVLAYAHAFSHSHFLDHDHSAERNEEIEEKVNHEKGEDRKEQGK